MNIAFIGTGVMGTPMAEHLIAGGHRVTVFNRSPEKLKPFIGKAFIAKNLKDAVQEAEIVFSIVSEPKDVESIYQIIIPSVKPKTILIDMTTSSPSLAKKLFLEAKKRNVSMLDAPVTGGDVGAKNATLTIMVGGEELVFNRIKPLLMLMGKNILYVGDAGKGMEAKLCNQIAIAGTLASLAEALAFAQVKKLNLPLVNQIISGGAASSFQSIQNGPKMIQKDYTPGFYLRLFLKDLNIALAEKESLNVPVTESVQKILETLVAKNFGNQSTVAIIEYYLNRMS